ncbi:MAG: hypothetical protein ACJ75F_01425 [Flavisolibacter sp.]
MYRILRDNKERGPLSLEELLALQLKPMDLVWIEGKSAGWRYPSEIDSLKPYLENALPAQSTPVPALSQPSQIHPASQNTRSSAGPSSVNSSAPQQPTDVDDSNEEELTNEKLEKKAAELYQRVQAYSQLQEKQQQETQTKYARSLEDLKQDYADWLHKKKQKKNFRLVSIGKPGLIAVAASIILICGYLFLFRTETKVPEPGLKPGEKYISNASFQPVSTETKSELPPPVVIPKEKNVEKNEVATTLTVDQFIDSIRRAMAKDHPSKKARQPRNEQTNVDAVESTPVVSAEPQPTAVKKEVPASQQVNMNASYQQDAHRKNISSLEVTIQNNSSDILKMVSVDIFYYKKGDRLFDKETLFFNNIQPGSSMTLSRPGNRKAMTARFQLGQIQPVN